MADRRKKENDEFRDKVSNSTNSDYAINYRNVNPEEARRLALEQSYVAFNALRSFLNKEKEPLGKDLGTDWFFLPRHFIWLTPTSALFHSSFYMHLFKMFKKDTLDVLFLKFRDGVSTIAGVHNKVSDFIDYDKVKESMIKSFQTEVLCNLKPVFARYAWTTAGIGVGKIQGLLIDSITEALHQFNFGNLNINKIPSFISKDLDRQGLKKYKNIILCDNLVLLLNIIDLRKAYFEGDGFYQLNGFMSFTERHGGKMLPLPIPNSCDKESIVAMLDKLIQQFLCMYLLTSTYTQDGFQISDDGIVELICAYGQSFKDCPEIFGSWKDEEVLTSEGFFLRALLISNG